uniref:Queuosine 5'-phosphate N-glycosylase/hydrolase n=1 Tax=Lygus hesperus TaxID=30085 RepID=A0A146KVD5_LYGHE
MSEILSPRESGVFISKNAKHVSIHEEAIPKMVHDLYLALEKGGLRKYSITEHETFPSKHLSQKEALNYVLFLDALNFCFWSPPGKPHWTVKFQDVSYTGYFALCAAVARAYDEGIHIFDPTVYSKFTLSELEEMLKGENGVPAPMVEERLKCLQEVGTVLLAKFGGSFENVVLQAKNSAQALLKLVVENFPCFDDSCDYLGKRVSFHKRAQILVGDVWGLYYGQGISEFRDVDTITMFADYRVPQVLVAYGILQYSDELMGVLRKNEILQSGCEFEIEIRGCSIRAVDLVVQAIREYMRKDDRVYYSECNDISVDNYLWSYRREHVARMDATPFHKVISIYY